MTDHLHTLDRLVGTWAVTGGGLSGTVTYAWMEGGRFLVQQVDLVHDGQANRGVEYIGYDQDSGTLRSHFFGAGGEILEYTYELSGDILTIWFGDTSSPARFVGTFSADGSTNTGAWEWPGGGYESTMTRVEDPAR
ncbi:hypothetical protein [Jiangella mangrovi]|uniref:DUF1579 domain-containing protein n=1 Tax=Jiangella mangrovi TaxID=1524084 RepID=A0A7W9LJ43_9ACTN|nr:hypothetical protein [Jiangella mangrovi]MBB5785726.1 hypothetical protein [Jiangella mangrovi]